jgi:hypothetical protein
VNVVVIRYGVRHKEKKHKHLPSKHSFTLIENDKSSQINQTIWRMLRVGAPNVFQLCLVIIILYQKKKIDNKNK